MRPTWPTLPTLPQHGLHCDFWFRCTPDPGSKRFRRRSMIHCELQMLLLELKLKTSNNVTKCLGVEMNNDQAVASNDPIIIKICELCCHCYLAEIMPVCSNYAKNYASIIYKGVVVTLVGSIIGLNYIPPFSSPRPVS